MFATQLVYKVEYLSCYTRSAIKGTLLQKLKTKSVAVPDLVVIASTQALELLVSKIEAENIRGILNAQTLVLGARLASTISSFGFSLAPIIVNDFDDTYVSSRIKEWVARSL